MGLIGGAAPGLDVLGKALRVWWCENAQFGGVPEGFRQVIQEGRDSLGDANRGEYAGSKEGVATEAVVKNVLRAGDVGVYPRNVGQLFQLEGGDGAFVTLADPFEGQVVAVGIEGVWR